MIQAKLPTYVAKVITVFPQIRPAGIIFLQGLQLRVLLERGYYSRASIIFKMCKLWKLKPAFYLIGGRNCWFVVK